MIYVVHNNEQIGPLSESDIRQKLSAGDLDADDMAWKEGMAGWQPLRTVLDPQPASRPDAPLAQFSQHLPKVHEWGFRVWSVLKKSVGRPAYIVLWCCAVVLLFQGCQMNTLSRQIAEVQGTDFMGDFIAGAIGVFVSPEPFTPFFAALASLGAMVDQDATLEELQSAYQAAEVWRDLAILAAVGTLLFVWFKKWRAKRKETAA
jgi:hypothetical protein